MSVKDQFKYKAFISYSHAADGKLAPALQSALHRFAKAWYRLRAMRVFRDKTTLAMTAELWPSIERALSESEYFVLLASPQAAESQWVQQEVDWWLRNRAANTLFIVMTEGAIFWDRTNDDFDWAKTTALPPSLRSQFKNEPLYVDLRWARSEEKLSLRHLQFRAAVLDIASPLLGKSKDELDGEDVRQHRRTKQVSWAAAIAIVAFAVAAGWQAVVATRERNEAQSQRAIADDQRRNAEARLGDAVDLAKTILGGIDQKLLPVAGAEPVRLELLQATSNLLDRLQAGAENNAVLRARMEGHGQQGNLAESRDLSVAAREYEQYAILAESLQIAQGGAAEPGRDVAAAYRNLGNVQLQQGHTAKARQSLDKAVSLGQELASRSLGAPQFTYDLAQSYRGLGDVARLQEDFAAARAAYMKLVKLSDELLKTDASSISYRWQSALAYTSLADLEMDAGNPTAAKRPLKNSRRILESLRAGPGRDQRLDFALATAYCKSAEAAKATGDDGEAQRWYERCIEESTALRNANPDNAQYRQALAAAYVGHGDLLARTGEPGRARDAFVSAIALLDAVIERDPSNAVCRWQLASVHQRLAAFAQQLRNWKEARAELESSLKLKKQLVDSDPDNTRWQRDLLKTYADILRLSDHPQAGIPFQEYLQAAKTLLVHLRRDPLSARHSAVLETAALLKQFRYRERYVPVSLFDFLGKSLIVNTPVFLSLPRNYVISPIGEGDAIDGFLWGVKEDLDIVRQTGGDFTRIKHGVFHARASMNVGYFDGRFSAEDDLQANMAKVNATNVNVVKETIATYPTLTLTADVSGKRLSMFYLALGIDSNTVLINYRHPQVRTPLDDEVWREFRSGFVMDVVNRWDRGQSGFDIITNALARLAVVPSYVSQFTLQTTLGPKTSRKRPFVRQSCDLKVHDGKLADLRTEIDSSNELIRHAKNQVWINTYSGSVFDQGKATYRVDPAGRVFASKGAPEVTSEVQEPFAVAGTNELLSLMGFPFAARTPMHEFLARQLSFYDLRFIGETDGRLVLEGKIKVAKAKPVLNNLQLRDDVAMLALNRIAVLRLWVSKKDYRFERMGVSGVQDNLPFQTQLHLLGFEPE
jgi:tetratricopeptide (TPR) repeat protein